MNNINRVSSPWCPSRRDLLWLGMGGLVAAVPFARRRPLTLVRRDALVMGTIAKLAVAHRDPRLANAAIDDAIDALRWVDTTMSRFKDSSDVGRANLSARLAPVSVTVETMQVLRAGLQWAADSNGAFDPCLGRAVTLWDVNHRHEPPPAADVARLAGRQFHRSLELGTERGTPVVRFHDPELMIDLGGIGKGYAVDRAVAALRRRGIEHALVGLAGDLYALGRSPSGEPWHVGIQAPDRADALVGSLYLEDAAVTTSGDYQQYFVYRHRRYHHLLDPQTAAPRLSAQRSVSVVAPACMTADAAATLAFVIGAPEAERILARRGARIAHSI